MHQARFVLKRGVAVALALAVSDSSDSTVDVTLDFELAQ